jgi:hypothetical protein
LPVLQSTQPFPSFWENHSRNEFFFFAISTDSSLYDDPLQLRHTQTQLCRLL